MDYNPEKFRIILEDVMGKMSKKDFAAKCGITQETLVRCTTKNKATRPSRMTLRKIANNTSLSLEDLLDACGYEDGMSRFNMDINKRALLNIENIHNGMSRMISGVRLYKNLQDFMDSYTYLFSKETIRVSIDKKKEYYGDRHNGAEYFAPVCIKFESKDGTCRTWLVLYFCETMGGKHIVMDYAMDGESLIEAGIIGPEAYDMLYEQGQKPEELPYYYDVRRNAKEMEKRLLKAIFGTGDVEFTSAMAGFGFELNEIPKQYKDFLKNHKETICTSLERIKIYEAVLEGKKEPEEVFAEYKDEETWEEGFGAIVTRIMRKETDIPFEWVEGKDDYPSCVLLPRTSEDYRTRELKKIVYPYAKELGVHKFGECVTYITDYLDANAIYEI